MVLPSAIVVDILLSFLLFEEDTISCISRPIPLEFLLYFQNIFDSNFVCLFLIIQLFHSYIFYMNYVLIIFIAYFLF